MNQMEQYRHDHDAGLHTGIHVEECPQCDNRTAEEAHAEGMHAGDYNSECHDCILLQHEAEHKVPDGECEYCERARQMFRHKM